jgi:hypothetical protein
MKEMELKVFFCVAKLHVVDPISIAREISGEKHPPANLVDEVKSIFESLQKQKLFKRRWVGYRVKYLRVEITPEGEQLAKQMFGNLETCPLCGGNLSFYTLWGVKAKCEKCGRRWYT